jgi:hypothetical protein
MAKKKADKGESIQGYFRPIFQENPKLLKKRANDELFERWLKDHPGEKEVPLRVKQGLSNLKSVLRAKMKRRGRKRREEANGALAVTHSAPRAHRGLSLLETQIDDALQHARQLDPDGLDEVIRLLRTARNRVIVRVEGTS